MGALFPEPGRKCCSQAKPFRVFYQSITSKNRPTLKNQILWRWLR